MVKPTVNDWGQVADKTEKPGPLNAEAMIRCQVHVNPAGFLECGVFYALETVDENEITSASASQEPASFIKIAGENLLRAAGDPVLPRENTPQADSFLSEIGEKPLLPAFSPPYPLSQGSKRIPVYPNQALFSRLCCPN